MPACARSAHFAIHFAQCPQPQAAPGTVAKELSTADEQAFTQPVDESGAHLPSAGCAGCLGAVVPKRHARRAVTRNLLKRQIRAAASRGVAPGAPAGVWIVRLRAAFDRAQYPAGASDALRRAARAELDAVFSSAAARLRQAGSAR